jgi:hypothetical protein
LAPVRIIFCLSYLEVPQTIQLAAGSDSGHLIVTPHNRLVHLFEKIYGSDHVLFIDDIPKGLSPAHIISRISEILRWKKRWRALLAGYVSHDVFFSAVAYCEAESWLVMLLARNNSVYYRPIVELGTAIRPALAPLLRVVAYRISFGLKLETFRADRRLSFSIQRDFQKRFPSFSPSPYDAEGIRKVLAPSVRPGKVLLLVDGTIDFDQVEAEEYNSSMRRVSEILCEKIGAADIAVKPRAGRSESMPGGEDFAKLEDFWPANLLFPFFDIVISYASGALFEAANASKTSISLLYFMTPKTPETQERFRSYLLANAQKRIFFPAGPDELRSAITDGMRP